MRNFAEAAYNTLLKAGASANYVPTASRDLESEKSLVLSAILQLLPANLIVPHGEASVNHPLLLQTLEFQANLVADLVFSRK